MIYNISFSQIGIEYGPNPKTTVVADVIEDLGDDITKTHGSFKVTLSGNYDDGKDVEGMKDDVVAKLQAKGLIE